MKLPLTLIFLGLFAFSQAQNQSLVTFPSDGLNFNATLTTPDGTGPFPTVILVGGSGPNDRNQTFVITDPTAICLNPGLANQTLKIFEDLALRLADAGIASLRYDKRTYTHAAVLDPVNTSPYDFLIDVESALDYVLTLPDADTSCVVILGFSQGANYPPMVAINRPEVAAMISLAGAALPIDSLLPDQIRHIETNCGDSAAGEAAAQQMEVAFQQVRAGTYPSNQLLLGVYPLFWEDWIAITDSATWYYQNTTPPALFIQGMEDYNVPPINGQRFNSQVTRTQANVYFFDSLNHNLTRPTEPFLSMDVSDTIIHWLQNLKQTTSLPEWQSQSNWTIRPLIGTAGIQLSWESNEAIQQVLIHDLLGREIRNQPIPKGQQQWSVQLPGGQIYLVTGISAAGSSTQKVWVGN